MNCCTRVIGGSLAYVGGLIVPRPLYRFLSEANHGRTKPAMKFMGKANAAFIASIVLAGVSRLALSRTVAGSTAHNVFKMGVKGFAALAAFIAVAAAVRFGYFLSQRSENRQEVVWRDQRSAYHQGEMTERGRPGFPPIRADELVIAEQDGDPFDQ